MGHRGHLSTAAVCPAGRAGPHLGSALAGSYRVMVRVEVSPEAADFVRARGGRLWVWAARPRLCCWGTPAYMHAATGPPRGMSGFSLAPADGLDIWFRAPAGRLPDVLEIGLRGRRRPRVEAYWDGCLIAL